MCTRAGCWWRAARLGLSAGRPGWPGLLTPLSYCDYTVLCRLQAGAVVRLEIEQGGVVTRSVKCTLLTVASHSPSPHNTFSGYRVPDCACPAPAPSLARVSETTVGSAGRVANMLIY